MTNFRNYIYVSRNKAEQYLAQMPNEERLKVVSESKFKTPVLEQVVKIESESDKRESLFRDVDIVVDEVERRSLLGDFLDYKPWFRARLDVRAVLLGEKVFYIGSIRNADIIPVDFAMQCSLANLIGIDNHRQQIERVQSSGESIEKKLQVRQLHISVGGFTSANPTFGADLHNASRLVDRHETRLLSERLSEMEPRQFFKSKEHYERHERYKPTEQDQQVLSKYENANSKLRKMMSGSFHSPT